MRQARTLATMALALLALTATTATTALGAELLENLPEKAGRSTPGESVGSTIYETLTGLKIECTKATSTGEETSSKPPKGTFHITFTGCNSTIAGINIKCTGLGDAHAGEILSLGTTELVFDKNPLTGTLVTALLFNIEPTHLTCAGFVLVVMEGTMICLHVNATTKSKTHEFRCSQTKGDPEETKYWTSADVEKKAELHQKVGTEASEKLAIGLTGTSTTTEEIFADV